jgi:hypothetical protein
MEHIPAPRSSKERAASAAYRNRRPANYEKVKKLHSQGMSMMAICRAPGMSWGAVRRLGSTPTLSRSTATIHRRRACSTPSSRISRSAGKRVAAPPSPVERDKGARISRRSGTRPAMGQGSPGGADTHHPGQVCALDAAKDLKELDTEKDPLVVLSSAGVDDGGRSRGSLLYRGASPGTGYGGLPRRGGDLPIRPEVREDSSLPEGRRIRGMAGRGPLVWGEGVRDLRRRVE